jgi:hypothetical protein
LRWLDDRYLLVGHAHLIDTRSQSPVWRYDLPLARPVERAFDGNVWLVALDPTVAGRGWYLGAVPTPSALVQSETGDVEAGKPLPLAPGDAEKQLGRSRLTLRGEVPIPNAPSPVMAPPR